MGSLGRNYEQPAGGVSRQGGHGRVRTEVRKGDYSTLESVAAALRPYEDDAAAPSGKVRVSWNLEHLPGGLGKLTITRQELGKSEDTPAPDAKVDAVSYTVRNVQTSLPLTRYCGPSQGANAYAHDIMKWREEPDKLLYEAFSYRKEDGEVVTLTEASQKLAKKYLTGTEEVMRFYPVVTKVTVYAEGANITKISGLGKDLAHIQAPPIMSDIAPAWMKIQDEASIDGNGIITRTEGWQGAEAFDVNLYGNGEERWEFGTI